MKIGGMTGVGLSSYVKRTTDVKRAIGSDPGLEPFKDFKGGSGQRNRQQPAPRAARKEIIA